MSRIVRAMAIDQMIEPHTSTSLYLIERSDGSYVISTSGATESMCLDHAQMLFDHIVKQAVHGPYVVKEAPDAIIDNMQATLNATESKDGALWG